MNLSSLLVFLILPFHVAGEMERIRRLPRNVLMLNDESENVAQDSFTELQLVEDAERSSIEEMKQWERFLQMDTSMSIPTIVSPETILDVVVSDPDLSTLVVAVTTAGIQDLFTTDLPFTLLAPVNDAFSAIDPTLLGLLLEPEWINHLQTILGLHVSGAGLVLSTDLTNNMTVPTLIDDDLIVDLSDGVSFMGPVNSASVVEADLVATNGVVHKIDVVLLPSFLTQTVVDVGASDPNFSTLVELVVMAGLDGTLSEGIFTVLAPPNDAFAALPSELLDAVLADMGLLQSVLLYHVLPAVVPSQKLSDGLMIATALSDTTVTVSVKDDGVFIDDAQVIAPDIVASNGIVHVISSVLLPPSE